MTDPAPLTDAEQALTLIYWGEEDTWLGSWPAGYMQWLCRCGKPLVVEWTSNCSLYNTDEPITPNHPITNTWQVECHNGHVLLVCHELADDESGDTFEAPTTPQIVDRLASPEDVAKWLSACAQQADVVRP